MTQLHQTRLPAQRQYLHKQPRQHFQIVLAKVRDRAEIRRVVRRQHPERYVLHKTLRNPSRGRHPDAVAVQQHLDHHPWMVRRPASALPLVASRDLRQVQLLHDVGDEVSQMVIGQPLLQRLPQQQLLVGVIGKIGLAHRSPPSARCSYNLTPNNSQTVLLGQAARLNSRTSRLDSHSRACNKRH